MRKLVESTFVTLDGAIDAPHVWGPPYWDDEHTAYASGLLERADALVLGRETYEGFARSWPGRSGDPFSDKINAMPKHVASRTLAGDLTWNASLIEGDAAEGVAALKRGSGGDLLKYGTGELDAALLEHGLIDELHLWVFPVLAGGRGRRMIEGIGTTHLRLLDSSTFASGIVVHVLGPAAR
jgi:dihydrofolate reductase